MTGRDDRPRDQRRWDQESVRFLQWALPRLDMRWPGFRRVRRQVARRLRRRLEELNVPDLDAYRDRLARDPAEWRVLDAFCRISISRFYRDWDVFEHLRGAVLPQLAARRATSRQPLACWSCGCASGEEPFTLAILWRRELAPRYPRLPFRVVATDIDGALLERAERGCYGETGVRGLPAAWREAAFERIKPTRSGDTYRLRPEYREPVELQQMDVRRAAPEGRFGLILCRNLAFTYFAPSLQAAVLERLLAHLEPGGWLVTAKKEQLPLGPWPLQPDPRTPGFYRRDASA